MLLQDKLAPQDKFAVTQGRLAATIRAVDIHRRIKARREQLGLSLQDLAKVVGVSWQAAQQWEKRTAPKRARLSAVAVALKTTPDFLLFGAPPQAGQPERGTAMKELESAWPFESVDRRRWESLSERQKGALENEMNAALVRIESAGGPGHGGAAGGPSRKRRAA